MSDRMVWAADDEATAKTRVARGAVRQASRHERAIEACLAELAGDGAPDPSLVDFMLRRARRHAGHAESLVQMASRVNQDDDVALTLAAKMEHHERNHLRVVEWHSPRAAVTEAA
jgi:hypothetical protein